MALGNRDNTGHAAPSETSPLLANAYGKTSDGKLTIVPNEPIEEQVGDDGRIGDEEAPEMGQAPNPLMEGLPEVAEKMHVLLPAIGVGVFLAALDQTIIVSTYAKIGSEMNALNSTSWIATAYFLTLTTFQPLYGKLSDIFGRKVALLSAYTIFGIGCLFCGLARTMPELIAARAFAGIGGGGMTTVVTVLLSDIIPLRERGKWQGYLNIIYALGASSGAPLGGVLADSIGWRWAFLLQVPMCALAFITVCFRLDLPAASRAHWVTRLGHIDFLGASLLILATSSLLVGLDLGSNTSWTSTLTISLIGASLPIYILFMVVEHYVSHPFAPSGIIFNRLLSPPLICNFFSFAGYMAMLFYVPLLFQAVSGYTSTEAGLLLIPGIAGSVTGSIGGGIFMQRTGKYYWLTILGYIMMVTGITTIFLCSGVLVTSTLGTLVAFCLTGLGGGISVTTTLIALVACADPSDMAIVTACSYLFRSLGSAVGVSLSAALVQQRLRYQLAKMLGDGEETEKIVRGVRESLEYLEKLTPETLFAVPMTCESCVQDVSGSLHKLEGISKVEANLKDQLISIEGTAAPSAIVSAIQGTGRDAILRGTGTTDSSAVCILETHSQQLSDKVKGLIRMVQVSSSLTLFDLTIRGLAPGKYNATIRETGDISQGVVSTGAMWKDSAKDGPQGFKGRLGTVDVDGNGLGSVFIDKPIQIWEMIGRSIVVSRQHDGEGKFEKNDDNTLVGVIARSPGVWDNDKTVCSCSGKTLWEERKDEVGKGMI
ncbi:hypothetical protein V498_04979 [Pseudogymnoascus sp. VKM F-4517 (FW-2822)]|nr:hypothetical protein V498_04979 [Pseudogymnoascus sp. VKM F-4517 (FW-2822)]